MVTTLALVGALVVGLLIGLTWQGVVHIGDCHVIDRLSRQLVAEQRLQEATRQTLNRMRAEVLDRNRSAR